MKNAWVLLCISIIIGVSISGCLGGEDDGDDGDGEDDDEKNTIIDNTTEPQLYKYSIENFSYSVNNLSHDEIVSILDGINISVILLKTDAYGVLRVNISFDDMLDLYEINIDGIPETFLHTYYFYNTTNNVIQFQFLYCSTSEVYTDSPEFEAFLTSEYNILWKLSDIITVEFFFYDNFTFLYHNTFYHSEIPE